MVTEIRPAFRTKVSNNELERRWKAVRQAMKEADIDLLFMQNWTDILGGYVRWFTDMSTKNNYPLSLVFPRDEGMTVIKHGARTIKETETPKGFKRIISVPAIPSLAFSNNFEAEAVVTEFSKYRNLHIGFVGTGFINAATYNYLTKHLDTAKFTDATDLVDNIKAIKSDEEIEHLRELAAAQDATFAYALSVIKPGRRDYEVYADVFHHCLLTGSTAVNLATSSAPAGVAHPRGEPRDNNRVLQEGDQMWILLESNGPSGYFTEIVRNICVGKVYPEMHEQFELTKESHRLTMSMLKPGANPIDIWEANNEFMRKRGYAEEKRLLFHGMGYDMVERPSVQVGETMKIQSGMCIAAHAQVSSPKARASMCDQYIVTTKGNEPLHKTAQKVFVV
jgi:Xaa-Pro aminopeptidase